MVDYCPEKEDTFLVDDRVNSRVAAKYHVVFFDRAQNVARAWVDKEQVKHWHRNPKKGSSGAGVKAVQRGGAPQAHHHLQERRDQEALPAGQGHGARRPEFAEN